MIVRATESDNGGAVELSAGDELQVMLKANATAGYKWVLRESNPAVLRPDSGDFVSATGAIGSEGTETLNFKAIGAGRSLLKLSLIRPFEAGKPPIKEFCLTAKVTNGAETS